MIRSADGEQRETSPATLIAENQALKQRIECLESALRAANRLNADLNAEIKSLQESEPRNIDSDAEIREPQSSKNLHADLTVEINSPPESKQQDINSGTEIREPQSSKHLHADQTLEIKSPAESKRHNIDSDANIWEPRSSKRLHADRTAEIISPPESERQNIDSGAEIGEPQSTEHLNDAEFGAETTTLRASENYNDVDSCAETMASNRIVTSYEEKSVSRLASSPRGEETMAILSKIDYRTSGLMLWIFSPFTFLKILTYSNINTSTHEQIS